MCEVYISGWLSICLFVERELWPDLPILCVMRSCFNFPIGRQVRYCPMGEVGGGGQRLWSRQRLEADGQSELSPAETARELQTHSDSDLNTLDQILNQPNHLRKESNTPSEETWPTHAGAARTARQTQHHRSDIISNLCSSQFWYSTASCLQTTQHRRWTS